MNTENMMLVDAHIHTNGISFCSRLSPEQLVDACVNDNVDAIVLTNHCKSPYIKDKPYSDWCRDYVKEYHITKKLGEQKGLKVFFGIEITPDCMPKNDFTVYGLSEKDILTSPPLFQFGLEELCNYVHEKSALIYHAHPYRNTVPVDGSLLDGTEINCHPLYGSCQEVKVRKFADAFGLRLSCGSDFHGDTYKPHCGMWVPSSIDTTEEFVEYIRTIRRPELLIAPDSRPETADAE